MSKDRPAEHFLYRMPAIKWTVRSESDCRSFTFSSPVALLKVTRFYEEDEQRWGDWQAFVEDDERNSTSPSFNSLREAKAYCVRDYYERLASCLERVSVDS